MLSTISVIFGDDGVVVPSQTRMLLDNMRTCIVGRARGTAIAARRAAAAAAEACIIILVVVGKKPPRTSNSLVSRRRWARLVCLAEGSQPKRVGGGIC